MGHSIKATIELTQYELIEMLEEAINTTTPDLIHVKILIGLGLVERIKGQAGVFVTDKVECKEGFSKDEVINIKLQ